MFKASQYRTVRLQDQGPRTADGEFQKRFAVSGWWFESCTCPSQILRILSLVALLQFNRFTAWQGSRSRIEEAGRKTAVESMHVLASWPFQIMFSNCHKCKCSYRMYECIFYIFLLSLHTMLHKVAQSMSLEVSRMGSALPLAHPEESLSWLFLMTVQSIPKWRNMKKHEETI